MAHAEHGGGSGLQLLDARLFLILRKVLGEDSLVPGEDVRLPEGPLVHVLDFHVLGGNSIALKKGLKKGPKKGPKVNLLRTYA